MIMVAVDTVNPDDVRQPAIQHAVAQALSASAEFRLLCVSVIRDLLYADMSRVHLEQLVRLRNWVEPLRMPAQRLSLHAIESPDPAEAIIDLARRNNVDLIILGAGPVRFEVAEKAHCSVELVRVQ
jgi:nucleotide-binding universal stress UspA family protein